MQIIDIFESLQKAQIMHRDIRPDNMLVVDGNIKLIDFQYAIDLRKPKELKCVKNNNVVARHLGNENFRYKSYGWKDSASIVKLLHYYGFNTDNIMLTKDKTFYMSLIQYCVASFEKLCLRTKRRLLIIMGTYDGSLDQYI